MQNTTIIDLAELLGTEPAGFLALIGGDPTGTDYFAGPDPDRRVIETGTGTHENMVLTPEGADVLTAAVTISGKAWADLVAAGHGLTDPDGEFVFDAEAAADAIRRGDVSPRDFPNDDVTFDPTNPEHWVAAAYASRGPWWIPTK